MGYFHTLVLSVSLSSLGSAFSHVPRGMGRMCEEWRGTVSVYYYYYLEGLFNCMKVVCG